MSFLYGHPNLSDRPSTWKLVTDVLKMAQGLLLVCGDFNQALSSAEKSGRH